jgi:hypothetical protein
MQRMPANVICRERFITIGDMDMSLVVKSDLFLLKCIGIFSRSFADYLKDVYLDVDREDDSEEVREMLGGLWLFLGGLPGVLPLIIPLHGQARLIAGLVGSLLVVYALTQSTIHLVFEWVNRRLPDGRWGARVVRGTWTWWMVYLPMSFLWIWIMVG